MAIDLANLATEMDFSPAEIQHMLDNLDSFSPEELEEVDRIVGELSTRKYNQSAHDDLIEFCKRVGTTGYWQISLWRWKTALRTVCASTYPHGMGSRSLCLYSTQRGS